MGNVTTAWQRLSSLALTTEQVRAVDRLAVDQYGMHSLVLMENAALGCVQWLRKRFENEQPESAPPRTVILCGSGNNGGDGLVIARHLRCWGWPCTVFLLGPPEKLTTDTRTNAEILLAGNPAGVTWWGAGAARNQLHHALAQADVLIDAMLGTGATGHPRSPLDEWIEAANATTAFRVAIDIPTGADASSGECGTPTFAAAATLTFVALKPAMQSAQAEQVFGEIDVLPIGIPEPLIRAVLADCS